MKIILLELLDDEDAGPDEIPFFSAVVRNDAGQVIFFDSLEAAEAYANLEGIENWDAEDLDAILPEGD